MNTRFRLPLLALAAVLLPVMMQPRAVAGTEPMLGFLLGQDWMNMYESGVAAKEMGAVYYVEGVADADAAFVAAGHRKWCLPKGLTGRTISEVVHQWYIKHPDWLNDPAGVAISTALMGSFACRH